MNFGSTQSTSAAGLVRMGNHVIALSNIIIALSVHVSVGLWVNKIVNKLLSKLNWKVVIELASSNSCWKLQYLFLRSIYHCYNYIPNNIYLFLILRFFLPSVIPLKEILVKKWTSYSQRIWHWQNEALPYLIRKHNCSMSKKKSLLFVLEHVFSFFFFFFKKPSLLDWYQSIISCWLSCLPLG